MRAKKINESNDVRVKTYYKIQDIYKNSNSDTETYDEFFNGPWRKENVSYDDLLTFAKWSFVNDVWPGDILNILNMLNHHDLKTSDLDMKPGSFKTFKEYETYVSIVVKQKSGEPVSELDGITIADLERIFNKRNEAGERLALDINTGERFPFKKWLDHMDLTIDQAIKEIKGHIKFMDEEIESYSDALKDVEIYHEPVAMRHFLNRKLEYPKFMKRYWELVLEIALEYKNKK